jgi:hypothetical protein
MVNADTGATTTTDAWKEQKKQKEKSSLFRNKHNAMKKAVPRIPNIEN